LTYDLSLLQSLLETGIFLATPIMFASLGILTAELAGVYNFGMEGIMLLGAIASFLGTLILKSVVIGIAIGLITGVAVGALIAYFEVTLGADQLILTIALLIIGPSLSDYLHGVYVASIGGLSASVKTFPYIPIPYFSALPIIGSFFDQTLITYILYVVVVCAHIFFYHTKLGLKYRSVGMDPMVADAMGINVILVRYLALIISSILGAFGGIAVIIGETGYWSTDITAGAGIIAIALVRVGNWRTHFIYLAAIVLNIIVAYGSYLTVLYSSGGYSSGSFPYEVFNMIPYIFAIIVIVISFKWARSNEPTSLGKPYKRG